MKRKFTKGGRGYSVLRQESLVADGEELSVYPDALRALRNNAF